MLPVIFLDHPMCNFKSAKHLVALGLSCLLALALTGCGKTLDFRNAEIVNGKIYKSGANDPFSGKVTNIPDTKILLPLQGLSPVLDLLKALLLAKHSSFLDRTLFTSSLCDVHVQDGELNGDVTCKQPESDSLRYKMSFKDAALEGAFTLYDQSTSNNPVVSTNFKHGLLDGKYELFTPDTHKLIYQSHWDNGVISGDVENFDEQTGNLTGHVHLVNGKAEGEIVRYAPDGKTVIYKVNSIQGMKDGPEDQYDPQTGKLVGHGEWANGKAQGVFRQWDANGTLTSEHTYANGEEVTTASNDLTTTTDTTAPAQTDAATDACVDQWIAAFRKGQGDDAVVSNDQLGEWQGWCKQGKHPG